MADLAIQTRPAAAGFAWLRAGLLLFRQRPIALSVFVSLGPLVLLCAALAPYVGVTFFLMGLPAAYLGMLNVCGAVRAGQQPTLEDYLRPLRDPVTRVALLRIGVFNALAMGTILEVWWLAFGDADKVPLTPGRIALALAGFAAWLPVQMTLWFAPALASWYAMPAGKALFFSFFTCWRNRTPMLLYLVGMFGVATVIGMAFGSLLEILQAGDVLARYLLAPLPPVLFAINQAGNLAMMRDVFAQDAPPPEEDSPPPSAD